ncbi:MAG: hypothetical protein LBL67_04130 [Coriobacteriales bacterium]|nr:hypothetical protein [Coriobacteriales bacterium]
MKVTHTPDKDQANLIVFKITVPAAEVDAAIKSVYKEAAQVRIPGFRPGRAPRPVLNRVYGGKDYFLAKATDEVVNGNAPQAVDGADYIAIDQAKFDDSGMVEEGKDYNFGFKVEVVPQIELPDYGPVQIELPPDEPSAADIDKEIDRLRQFYAVYDKDDKGEQKEKKLPELTDQWVKDTLEFESVDELRERVADSIKAQNSQTLPQLKENLAVIALGERVEQEPPKALVEQKEVSIFQDLYRMLNQNQITYDSYLEQLGKTADEYKEQTHDSALRQVKEELALDAVARQAKLKATKSEVVEEFKKAGAEDPEQSYANWEKRGNLAEIKQGILRMKATKHVVDTAEVFDIGKLPEKKKAAKKSDNKADKEPAPKKTAAKKPAAKKAAASKASDK